MYYMNDNSAEFALGWRQLYNRGVADVSLTAGKVYDAVKNKNPIGDVRELWAERQRMVRDLDARSGPGKSGATRQNIDRLQQFRNMDYQTGGPVPRNLGNRANIYKSRMYDDPMLEYSTRDYVAKND